MGNFPDSFSTHTQKKKKILKKDPFFGHMVLGAIIKTHK